MSHKEVIDVPELEDSRGRAFEQCVKVGNRVFVAGQTGVNPDGAIPLEFESQVRRTFERINLAMNAAGGSLSDLVRSTTYITDMRYKDTFTEIRGDILGKNLATSALIGVESLAQPEMLIEIEVEGWIPDEGQGR